MLAAHGKQWFATETEVRRDRGFVAAISGTTRKLLASAPALFATQPIVEVHATNIDAKALKQLLAAPWLSRVRHLVLKGELGDAGFKALAATPSLQQLEHLNVLGCKIDPRRGSSVCPVVFRRVRTLVLTSNPIGDEGIMALRAWAPLGDVEALYLSGCKITSKGADELLGAPLAQLEKLTLSGNSLGDAIGPMLVAAARRLPALRRLELKKIGATAALVATLGTPAYAVDVRENRIRANDVTGRPQFRAA